VMIDAALQGYGARGRAGGFAGRRRSTIDGLWGLRRRSEGRRAHQGGRVMGPDARCVRKHGPAGMALAGLF
jgi:hypothetical protein